ncbi:PREDICTED: probable endoplasmic reticulum-Golgi intermediate compartment protein 3 [Populus euphratica]|uniref:Probable endoplasmic reticulum-Golgi intermediate compartment protein 3 n=1 Tax=Populus euphratica TaxID=75702 RepID=A0AAJ6T5C8_POPEU|nr:PREDICTED: probable endoplasmic reticulum-Golgi intermediate compartment protein 3 [Populus euphratica]
MRICTDRFKDRLAESVILVMIQLMHDTPNGVQEFFIKVVPIIYTDIRGRTVHSDQYSVTEHFKKSELTPLDSLPGVYFFYDFSPIKVIFKEEPISFLHFMASVCAIIGGNFTIAGIIDSYI